MLKVTEAGSTKVTYIEPPNERNERLQEAKKKNSKSVFSKLMSLFKSSKN